MVRLKLVSFEQAKNLKEIGFPQYSILYFYDRIGNLIYIEQCDNQEYSIFNKVFNDVKRYDAPSLELAAKWLREEKGMWIHMCKPNQRPSKWSSSVNGLNARFWIPCQEYDEYDEALSAGIDKAIEIIKEGKLNQ